MTTVAHICLMKSELPKALIAELSRSHADSESPGGFELALPSPGEQLQAVLEMLRMAGFRPWNFQGRRQPNEFKLSFSRVFSHDELLAAPYLEIAPRGPGHVDGISPRTNSPDVAFFETPSMDIALVGMGRCYVVSAKVRKALLSGGFSDLRWRQAKLRPSGTPPDERRSEYQKKISPPKRGPWWALRSELVLPQLAPSMPLFHTDHTPFTGDFSKGCWRRDGLYTHAELRYRAADLKAFGPFDLAHTREMFGELPGEYDRPLVASQRFYQYCLKHGIETSWQPVRIEE